MIDRPRNRSTVGGWVWLFLAGPIVWSLYFWVDILAADAGCPANRAALVTWVTVGLVGVSLVALAYYGRPTRRPRGSGSDNRDSLLGFGLLLGAVFVVTTLFIGAPALVLQPC